MIRKVLIANRGEIAVRIIRGCREMGIRTVAVFSEADRLSLHARMADEAYPIGKAPSSESYLVQERLIATAKKAGADAIHPGYGFLAENGDFAEAVEKAGLIWIGPPAEAIRLMGDKTIARQRMKAAGVPTVPGTLEPISNESDAIAMAEEIGFPVLLKAAAGGGGKGMRIVSRKEDFDSALSTARSEAKSAFGDDRVYIEKYLEDPRHIEFQILADKFGHVIHLGERECSIQRRHQKVVEESPSVLLTPEMRAQMGEAAVKAAQACGYQNAGTIEFLVDKHLNYYFLEMNTRLQVEHPVTEETTGIDLVKEQLKIASGIPLSYSQEEIQQYGHAIEVRIYAEDPANNFMPSAGIIQFLRPPNGPGVREDSGVYEGFEVSLFYDPILSKLIVWGKDRNEAIARMIRALKEYQIYGIQTTIPFGLMVMQNKNFQSGNFDTSFVEKEFRKGTFEQGDHSKIAAIAALLVSQGKVSSKLPVSQNHRTCESPWKIAGRTQNMR